MRIYRVENTRDGWVKIRFPFSRDVIDRIKTLGSHLREWEPDEKFWRLKHFAWVDNRDFLFPPHEWQQEQKQPGFFDTAEDSSPPPVPPVARPSASPHGVLHLLPSAPPEVIKAAWQALIKKHHPDAGGDTQIAQKINAAYLALKRDL